jgi:MAE_28990/MAE_18760-like HEPN
MYNNLFENAAKDIQTTRSIIRINRKLREIKSEELELNSQSKLLQELIDIIPTEQEWMVYEHCSIVTRLYSIYESFVENIINTWIEQLPTIINDYSALDEKIRRSHAEKVGDLISKSCKTKSGFKDSSVKDMIEGLYQGVTGSANYTLWQNAFSSHDNNIREKILGDLFNNANICDQTWIWINKHPKIIQFFQGEGTAAGKLEDFIEYRNDASHSNSKKDRSSLLNSNLLLEMCDFIEILCFSLLELVIHQTFDKQKQHGIVKEIGTIKRWFNKRKVAEIKLNQEISLSLSDRIYLTGDKYLQMAEIENLRVNNIDVSTQIVSSEMKVEVKLDVDARERLRIYQICKS